MTQRRTWLLWAGILVLTGWLGYRWFSRSTRSIDALMPADALLVIESAHLQDTASARTLRREMSLRQAPIFAEALQRFERFVYTPTLSAGGRPGSTDTTTVLRFLAGKTIRYSLHPLSRNTLDFLYYVPIDGAADQAFLELLQSPDPEQFRVLSHVFAGERILELVDLRNQSRGSFVLLDDYLVGSTSGILVENVVRRLHQPIRRPKATTFRSGRLGNEHLAALTVRPDVLRALFDSRTDATNSLVRLFLPAELHLRFRTGASRNHLIGYASDDIGERQDVAALFAGQTPTRITSADVIPQTTAQLYHIGTSDAARLGQQLARLLRTTSNDALRDRWAQIGPAAAELYGALQRDIVLCRLETASGQPRQVLLLKATDLKKLSETYQRVAYAAGARRGAPKTFVGHQILPLNVAELPATLFSSLFAGFRQSWITQHNGYLVVANAEDVMQEYLQQLERGAVWAADARQAALLNQTLRPANFTAFVRVDRSALGGADGQSLPTTWPASWRNLIGTSVNNLENMVYQASYGNEKISSTLVLGRTTRRASGAVLNRLLLQKKIEFNASLISAPVIAGSLGDGSAQIWAQNSASQFVLLTPQGDKIVQDTISGSIRSNALAADFLNNGRLQYLFMTSRLLYIADLRERSVRLQSVPLPPNTETSLLTAPHGSRNRNVVALVTTRDGHIFGLDRQARGFVRLFTAPSPGPLLLPYQVIDGPGGMEILGLQPNGTLNRWREGNPRQANGQAPHFPARLDLPFASPALLPSAAADLEPGVATPGVRLITETGELLRLNEQGLIAARTQLFRPVRDGVFRLFPDVDQTNWLLLRTTDTEVAVLDQQGHSRMEIRGLRDGLDNVRYHRFGAGVELLSVQSGGFTTLYDLSGRQIGDRSIPGDFPVALQYDDVANELHVVSAVAKAVQLFTIRLR